MQKVKLIFLLLLFDISLANAGVKEHMKDFFDSDSSNSSEPSYIKGQKGGYMSFGGYTSRYKINKAQLASMQMPSFKAGCGGIDFHAGGVSFISSDQVRKLIRNIGQNAGGLMTQLGIEMLSPKMSGLIKYFNKMQQDINSLNINSCNAARGMISAGAGLISKEAGCKVARVMKNDSSDEAEARAQCTSGGLATESLNSAPNAIKEKYKIDDINIAWKALRGSTIAHKNGSFNQELAEYFMALSGTIIFKGGSNDDQGESIDYFTAKITSAEIIQILLEGGSLTVHKCDEVEKCLNPSRNGSNYTITQDVAFLQSVRTMLDDIKEAIKTDDEKKLPKGTKEFLTATSIPIYKILNIHASYYADKAMNTDVLADHIALELLYDYFEKINKSMLFAVSKHEGKYSKTKVSQFFTTQKEIKQEIDKKCGELQDKMETYTDLIERTARIEAMLNFPPIRLLNHQLLVGRAGL